MPTCWHKGDEKRCCGAAVGRIHEMSLYEWVAWTNLFIRAFVEE